MKKGVVFYTIKSPLKNELLIQRLKPVEFGKLRQDDNAEIVL